MNTLIATIRTLAAGAALVVVGGCASVPIDNVSQDSAPIRIGYNQFRLVAPDGRRFSALPPFRIDGKVSTRIATYYRPAGFAYAPYLLSYFAGGPFYDGPFTPNPLYWDRFIPVIATVHLPTEDMLRKALPEGVLAPGGRLTGFLYFEGVGPDVGRVRMVADFPAAKDKGRVARLEIPFVVGNV